MDAEPRFWRSYACPVLATMGVFSGLNYLWIDRSLALHNVVPLALAVYLTGSLLALAVLWRAIRAGRLTPRSAGLDLSGWAPWKRLLGLVMLLFFGYGAFTSIEPAPVAAPSASASVVAPESDVATADVSPSPEPAWGDYCFWYVFLLSASLTEILVFVGVGFCLTEDYLQRRGAPPLLARGAAAFIGSVAFGLYHYTYPPPWSNYAIYPLMPVMLVSIVLFVVTRNVYLAFLLHNAFAAVGFTTEQYAVNPPDPMMSPATYQAPDALAPTLAAFIVPFLLLHWLESKSQRTANPGGTGGAAPPSR